VASRHRPYSAYYVHLEQANQIYIATIQRALSERGQVRQQTITIVQELADHAYADYLAEAEGAETADLLAAQEAFGACQTAPAELDQGHQATEKEVGGQLEAALNETWDAYVEPNETDHRHEPAATD